MSTEYNAWTEPNDDRTFGLYVALDGRYMALAGGSPGPYYTTCEDKTPLMFVASDPDNVADLIELLQVQVDALTRQVGS